LRKKILTIFSIFCQQKWSKVFFSKSKIPLCQSFAVKIT
jgi:hypothetical protein